MTDEEKKVKIRMLAGPTHVLDSIFIGDKSIGRHLPLLQKFKIGLIIDISSMQTRSEPWKKMGIWYIHADWPAGSKVEDPVRYQELARLVSAMKLGVSQGTGVLVQSLSGRTRCNFLVCAYLMFSYHWKPKKAIEFLGSKRRQVELSEIFQKELLSLGCILESSTEKRLSSDWSCAPSELGELVVANTFVNSLKIPQAVRSPKKKTVGSTRKKIEITWSIDFKLNPYIDAPLNVEGLIDRASITIPAVKELDANIGKYIENFMVLHFNDESKLKNYSISKQKKDLKLAKELLHVGLIKKKTLQEDSNPSFSDHVLYAKDFNRGLQIQNASHQSIQKSLCRDRFSYKNKSKIKNTICLSQANKIQAFAQPPKNKPNYKPYPNSPARRLNSSMSMARMTLNESISDIRIRHYSRSLLNKDASSEFLNSRTMYNVMPAGKKKASHDMTLAPVVSRSPTKRSPLVAVGHFSIDSRNNFLESKQDLSTKPERKRAGSSSIKSSFFLVKRKEASVYSQKTMTEI